MTRSPYRRPLVRSLAALAFSLPCGAQSSPPDSRSAPASDVLALQRRWWEAVPGSDTAYLALHSSPGLTVTLSSGRSFDRAALLGFAGGLSHPVSVRWDGDTILVSTSTLTVARAQATESADARPSVYRYLTVFERAGNGEWRVLSAQSTRAPLFSPRIPAAAAGGLDAYAGRYRTPRGYALRVVAADSMLTMIEPSGLELHYWPIGPALFESGYVAPDGAITRLGFSRDSLGRVAALSVLAPGSVTTFPRMQ